jgi:putative colanic acid biosysnthesis UDP-glucose lipid carrier transferase
LEDLGNRIKKRIFDLVIASFVLIFILSWMIPLISLLIKITSKGPIFFVQKRSGKNKLHFKCLKFRSMNVNSLAHLKQATKNDDRLTSVGRFLRSSSLDEFPQFLNVLRGHMSIVGPRPHMLKQTDEYSKVVNQYMVRHFLKPGITGWAQVNGYRGEVNSTEKLQGRVEHDVWYMENWSVWLDLKIIFLTAYNVIRGDKNAF